MLNRHHLDGGGRNVLTTAARHRTQRGHGLGLAAACAETYGAGNGKNESGGFHKKKMSYEVIAPS